MGRGRGRRAHARVLRADFDGGDLRATARDHYDRSVEDDNDKHHPCGYGLLITAVEVSEKSPAGSDPAPVPRGCKQS